MRERIVYGEGPTPSKVMLVGEAPGKEEGYKGRPFVGKTGQFQDRLFEQVGLARRNIYITNLKKNYEEGNPAPTPEDIKRWGPELLREIRNVKPEFIIAAGYHAIRFFLGDDAHLEAVHGIPHRWQADGIGAAILPTYHPAAHFYQPDLLAHTVYDYTRAAGVIRGKIAIEPPLDRHPDPKYFDLDDSCWDWYIGQLGHTDHDAIGLDTEGVPGDEWSFQVCVQPGTGFTLRRGHRNYKSARKLLKQKIRHHRPVLALHNALYDIEMSLGLGLDFLFELDVPLFDSQLGAYIQCIEPQSLKMLARRHCGMVMKEYEEVVGDVGRQKQLDYLERAMELTSTWPKPEGRVEKGNDGTTRIYTPQPISRRCEAILVDCYTGKTDQDGTPTDPYKRWLKCDRELRRQVERAMGRMPIGTLADIPLKEAVYYSGRDPDATLRVYLKQRKQIERSGQQPLMEMKMRMLRAAVAIKSNGILGRRASFEALSEAMDEKKDLLQGQISRKYFGGRPFNPMSSDQTATLLRRRGLQGVKKTKSGKMSTGKKSIEHLRFVDPAIELLETWREHQKVKSSFADPVLENWPEDQIDENTYTQPELVRIKCDLKISRVTSGRFSASLLEGQPSAPLLAIPVRNKLAEAVRDCYEAEDGYMLGSFDLDQAEMRIMADESGDPRMIKIFCEGKLDIHTDNAARLFGVKYDDVANSKEMKKRYRTPAKRAGFGVITGIQGGGLYDQLRMEGAGDGWDPKSCDKLIDDYLKKLYPSIEKYMHWCRKECVRQGGVIRDRWGMPRYLPAILNGAQGPRDEGFWDKLEAERQSHSHRIQGGAQGWLQNAMGHIWYHPTIQRYMRKDLFRFILQIHDELIFEAHRKIVDEVTPIITDAMMNHGGTKLRVPMKSSGAWAPTWGKLKD